MADVKTRYSVIEDLTKKIDNELSTYQEAIQELAKQKSNLEMRKRNDQRFYEDQETILKEAEKLLKEQKEIGDQKIQLVKDAIMAIKTAGGAPEKE